MYQSASESPHGGTIAHSMQPKMGGESCRLICPIPSMKLNALYPFQCKAVLPQRSSVEGKSVVNSVMRSLEKDNFPISDSTSCYNFCHIFLLQQLIIIYFISARSNMNLNAFQKHNTHGVHKSKYLKHCNYNFSIKNWKLK
jgi:hypothetical protein